MENSYTLQRSVLNQFAHFISGQCLLKETLSAVAHAVNITTYFRKRNAIFIWSIDSSHHSLGIHAYKATVPENVIPNSVLF